MYQVFYAVRNGEIAGSATAKQCPSVSCARVQLRAQAANTGKVYVGSSNTVTVPNGVDDTTTGFELAAGQTTDWLEIDNLNKLWIIGTTANEHLTYIALVV